MPARFKSKTKKKSGSKSKTTKTSKPRARKTYKPRYNNSGRGVVKIASSRPSIQRGYLPFGRSYFARLPYVENFAISADGTTGVASLGYYFRGNCVFDPRADNGGHQPLQYDMLALHYERVWVHGCAVELTFTNPTQDGMYVGYRVRAQTNTLPTSGMTLEHIQEVRDAYIRPINNTGSQSTTYKFYVSNHKVFGISKEQFSDLTYSHTVGDYTVVNTYIEPFAINTINATTAVIRCNIKLVYYVQFTNPISEGTN